MDTPQPASSDGEFISVFARVRPSEEPSPNLDIRPRSLELVVSRGAEVEECRADTYSYEFAEVFGPESSQQQVFDRVARDLVLGALDGINCSIFAYGQTGSGKTYTMCGGKANYMRDRGIIPRALGTIFQAIDARDDDAHYNVSMSMIEIYKEIGRDLLGNRADNPRKARPAVTVSLQKGEQPVMIGARRVGLASEEDGLQQYCLGEVQRTVAETSHNLASSRSHCVCTIFIEASDPGAQVVRTSKVQIVDLAGSERLKPYEKGSQENKALMKEAVSINLSLHHLSVVITSLNNRTKLIPYRNSFLTKLLKDALGGNARAAMVMTLDPSDAAMPETISSCRFAQRVANVRTNARVNEERDPQMVIAELRRRNAELQAAVAGGGAAGAEAALSDDELRARIQAFLEDDRGGSEGGSTLKVGPMPHGAVAAFRIFRELFWAGLLGSRERRSAPDETAGVQRENSWLTEAEQLVNQEAGERNSTFAHTDSEREALLQECQAECRMLRAALAAQPAPRPSKKAPTRSSREAKLQSDLIAAQGECKRLRSALAALSKSGSVRPAPRPRAKSKVRPKRAASSEPRSRSSRNSTTLSADLSQGSFAETSRRSFEMGGGNATSSERPFPSVQAAWGNSTMSEPPIGHSRKPDSASTSIATRVTDSSFQSVASGRTASAPSAPCPMSDHDSSVHGARPNDLSASSAAAAASDIATSATSATDSVMQAVSSYVTAQKAAPRKNGSASEAWLQATSALTEDELALCGSDSQAYQVFLKRDPRAGDIWQAELQKHGVDKRACIDEARTLGSEVSQMKEAMSKVQMALETLKSNLRQVEDAASVDAAAAQQAEILRKLIVVEEPKLELVLNEKRRSYQDGCKRLKELKHELIHIEHAQKKLEVTVKTEFNQWRGAVEQRYPMEVAAAVAAIAADTVASEEVAGDAEELPKDEFT